jgi:hypothetical protein
MLKSALYSYMIKRTLRWFDDLVKCDEEGVLKDVRQAAEGNEIKT